MKKVTQQLYRNPTHFPEAVNLHIPHTHFVTVLPPWATKTKKTCSTSWNHVAAGRLRGDSGALQLPLHYVFWVHITCARCHVDSAIQSKLEDQACPRLVKLGALSSTSPNKSGYFLWTAPICMGQRGWKRTWGEEKRERKKGEDRNFWVLRSYYQLQAGLLYHTHGSCCQNNCSFYLLVFQLLLEIFHWIFYQDS